MVEMKRFTAFIISFLLLFTMTFGSSAVAAEGDGPELQWEKEFEGQPSPFNPYYSNGELIAGITSVDEDVYKHDIMKMDSESGKVLSKWTLDGDLQYVEKNNEMYFFGYDENFSYFYNSDGEQLWRKSHLDNESHPYVELIDNILRISYYSESPKYIDVAFLTGKELDRGEFVWDDGNYNDYTHSLSYEEGSLYLVEEDMYGSYNGNKTLIDLPGVVPVEDHYLTYVEHQRSDGFKHYLLTFMNDNGEYAQSQMTYLLTYDAGYNLMSTTGLETNFNDNPELAFIHVEDDQIVARAGNTLFTANESGFITSSYGLLSDFGSYAYYYKELTDNRMFLMFQSGSVLLKDNIVEWAHSDQTADDSYNYYVDISDDYDHRVWLGGLDSIYEQSLSDGSINWRYSIPDGYEVEGFDVDTKSDRLFYQNTVIDYSNNERNFTTRIGMLDLSPEDTPPADAVPADKTWTIELSSEVDPASVSDATVWVTDASGETVEGISLSSDANKISVTAPSAGYVSGESYTLHVGKGLLSNEGTELKTAVEKDFTIQ